MRLVDTHNHLDFPDFDADRAALLQESFAESIHLIKLARYPIMIDP